MHILFVGMRGGLAAPHPHHWLIGVGKEGLCPSSCSFLVLCWRLRRQHSTKKYGVWGRLCRPQTPRWEAILPNCKADCCQAKPCLT